MMHTFGRILWFLSLLQFLPQINRVPGAYGFWTEPTTYKYVDTIAYPFDNSLHGKWIHMVSLNYEIQFLKKTTLFSMYSYHCKLQIADPAIFYESTYFKR